MKSVLDNLAEQYDGNKQYEKDDVVLHNNSLYKCLASTTGTFNASKWQRTYLAKLMGNK